MTSADGSVDKTAILPTDPVAEAGRKVFAGQIRRMQRQEAGSRTGEDIESVHRMRVAIRRMRSLLKLLPDFYRVGTVSKIEGGLREIARALGRIRDLDVLILDLENFSATQPPEQQAQILSVIDRLDQRRDNRRKRLNALFDSKGYARFLRQLSRFGKTPGRGARRIKRRRAPHQLRHVLPLLLHQRMARVKAYDTVLPSSDINDLHELRVEFKQLRYAVEFFEPVLGSSAGRFLRSVKAMQDFLGRIQDISVFMEAVSRLKRLTPEQAAALESYREARKAEQDRLRDQFEEIWTRFNNRATQRLFSDSLLVLR
ncbi:MAG: CHAD domain-containing protein [Chloroflexi bacterium]|nr:CHAD domain-containing protein [Chloroflexota bacterium]